MRDQLIEILRDQVPGVTAEHLERLADALQEVAGEDPFADSQVMELVAGPPRLGDQYERVSGVDRTRVVLLWPDEAADNAWIAHSDDGETISMNPRSDDWMLTRRFGIRVNDLKSPMPPVPAYVEALEKRFEEADALASAAVAFATAEGDFRKIADAYELLRRAVDRFLGFAEVR